MRCKSIWEERRDGILDDLIEQGYNYKDLKNMSYNDLKNELINYKNK